MGVTPPPAIPLHANDEHTETDSSLQKDVELQIQHTMASVVKITKLVMVWKPTY